MCADNKHGGGGGGGDLLKADFLKYLKSEWMQI